MDFSDKFMAALQDNDLHSVAQVPKADLHNHFVLGGNRDYLKRKTGFDIMPLKQTLRSMDKMHIWADENIGKRFDSKEMRKLLIEATFIQAKQDGVSVLEIGEDVWALGAYFNNDMDELVDAFQDAHARIAPNMELRLQIGMSRHCPVNDLLSWLEPFWDREEFYSIDLYGDELAQPIENFIPIYRKAKDCGFRLKAHIGEWGTAEDVVQGVELLLLDEVQHGIAAASSKEAVHYLRENKIRVNVTPSSNVFLGRVQEMAVHPIAKLYREGVDVTINSDDVLIFGSDVSKEYLSLYHNNVLSAEELNDIRLNGLKKI